MVSATDGRRAELKYQPILGGPDQMQATVPEVRPTQKEYPLDLSFFNNLLKTSISPSGSGRTTKADDDKAAKNALMNDYALKVSNLKSAYDQGKLNAQDLNIRTRQLTDEYLKQDIVGAKDLYSIQVAAIGTDVSGKLMDNDIARYEEILSYERNQRRQAAEDFRKNYAYAADMSDAQVQIEMNRISGVVDNAVIARNQYEQQRALGNPQLQIFKSNADNAVGQAVETNIPMFLANKIAEQPYGALNVQTLEQLRQDCLNGVVAYGINAGEASAIVDQALRRSGVIDLVNGKYQALTKSDEYNKKVIDTMQSTQKLGLYKSVPELLTISSVPPEVLPFILNADSQQKLFETGRKTVEYVQGISNGTDVDSDGTKLLNQLLNYSSKDVSIPSEIPIAQLSMLTNRHTVPSLAEIDNMDEGQLIDTLQNVNTVVSMYEDPAMQKRYEDVLSINPQLAEATKIKYVQAKQAQIGELIRSMKDSALADNLRYDPKDNMFKLVKLDKDSIWDEAGEMQWGNVYKSLASPYSLELLDNLNKTLNTTTKFVGDNNEIYIKSYLSEYSGIPEITAEDKLMTNPIANTVRKGYDILFTKTPVTETLTEIATNPLGTIATEFFRNPFARSNKRTQDQQVYEQMPDEYLNEGIDLEHSINVLKEDLKKPDITQHQKNYIRKGIAELEQRHKKLLA